MACREHAEAVWCRPKIGMLDYSHSNHAFWYLQIKNKLEPWSLVNILWWPP